MQVEYLSDSYECDRHIACKVDFNATTQILGNIINDNGTLLFSKYPSGEHSTYDFFNKDSATAMEWINSIVGAAEYSNAMQQLAKFITDQKELLLTVDPELETLNQKVDYTMMLLPTLLTTEPEDFAAASKEDYVTLVFGIEITWYKEKDRRYGISARLRNDATDHPNDPDKQYGTPTFSCQIYS